MNRKTLRKPTVVNLGTHGLKQQAPPDFGSFLTELFCIIFPDREALYQKVEVRGAHLANSEILFKPMSVVTGGGIRARVSMPGSDQTRQCDVFFESETLTVDQIFTAIREFCLKNPVTNENWRVIQDKGHVPNPIEEFWTEEKIALFIRGFLKYAATSVVWWQLVCISIDEFETLLTSVGCSIKRTDALDENIDHLAARKVVAKESRYGSQGGRTYVRILPGEYFARRCLAMMGTSEPEGDPVVVFNHTFMWLVREVTRLYDVQEDLGKEYPRIEKARLAAEAEVARARAVLERAEAALLGALETEDAFKRKREDARPQLAALLQTVREFGDGFSDFLSLSTVSAKSEKPTAK
jgi:hypothetical protein